MSTTRRTLLRGGAAALGAVAAVTPALGSDTSEAALIEASAEYCRLEQEYRRLSLAEDRLPGTSFEPNPEKEALNAETSRISARQRDLFDGVLSDVPALTEAGRQAKARALRAWLATGADGRNGDADDNLAWSLLHDVLGEEPWPDTELGKA